MVQLRPESWDLDSQDYSFYCTMVMLKYLQEVLIIKKMEYQCKKKKMKQFKGNVLSQPSPT